MTPERFHKLQQVLQARQTDLTVVMDWVHKPHNFNAIIRTCDAVGVFETHYIPVEEGFRPLTNTAKGSQKYVLAHQHDCFADVAKQLQQSGHQLLAAHLSAEAVDYRQIDYTQPTAIVMGAELEGVSPDTAAQVDQHIVIPMVGMVESLNVSVACALVLYEAQRQRQAAGMYTSQSLDQATFERVLFEWCWPKIARMCQRQNKPYPVLDENGEFSQF
ncbi:tRNA (guanosine(18)-2'-O)-methyltransferase TrmH [Marinicella meishanensis]|uniref:tRNA (guanosine(18)-2'-O)-methyltransferase TrmH n=1 Tax=Marinicella meishanensis TaxID=2873263 RepID=UPI001CBD08FD|nr:tRNA (guanosine(18)-2'-O)-methyltransferase TrmH [Marinicella sp. NBU2979]